MEPEGIEGDEGVLQEGLAEGASPVEEDELDAQLRAAGFTVGGESRVAAEEDGENDEDEEVDWERDQPDLEALRAEREEERRRIRDEMRERAVEEEDDETTMVNSASFAKRGKSTERWTKEETEFFFIVN